MIVRTSFAFKLAAVPVPARTADGDVVLEQLLERAPRIVADPFVHW